MAKVEKRDSPVSKRMMRPALSPEARENQMISMAMDLSEQRLRDGIATSQEITFWLKQGSLKEQLEMERLREENKLLKAKTEALQSAQSSEELYARAIKAFRNYSGQGDMDEEEYY